MEGVVPVEQPCGMASLPSQKRRWRPSVARVVLCGALAAAGVIALRRGRPRPAPTPSPGPHAGAAQRLGVAVSILSVSVLADSLVEHYRGAFNNPAMYLAPPTAAVMLATALGLARRPDELGGAGRAICAVAVATGGLGTGFHLYNIMKREGGIDWINLFYGAPLGAPFALTLAGAAGLAGSHLAAAGAAAPTLLGLPAGRVLAAGAAGGLVGTVAEAALLHFRGAYHDPFMYLPVTLPPLAASVLLASLARPALKRAARRLLQATTVLGVAGVGFHTYGIGRNMGGLYNWSQNILNGPPLPAPPAFTGVALAGLAALDLLG